MARDRFQTWTKGNERSDKGIIISIPALNTILYIVYVQLLTACQRQTDINSVIITG